MKLGQDLLYLSRAEVADLGVTMPTVVELMDAAYREKGAGNYQMPPKVALHTLPDTHPGDFIHSMPAFLPAMDAAGVKLVSGHVKARELGFPYISGLYVLMDVTTGIPVAVMDSVWITTMRTGAVTGLTAKYLANPDSSTLGIIGTGVQGRINLDGLVCTMPDLADVRVYDAYGASAQAYRDEMSERYPQLNIEVVTDPAEAVIDCDLLVSAVPCNVDPSMEFITADMIKPGATGLSVDDLVLYKPDVAAGAPFTKFFTDDHGQFKRFKNDGFFREYTELPVELGQMLIGQAPGREHREECIQTINIGTGLADLATAKHLMSVALERGAGQVLSL